MGCHAEKVRNKQPYSVNKCFENLRATMRGSL